jgi:hypothetical protein
MRRTRSEARCQTSDVRSPKAGMTKSDKQVTYGETMVSVLRRT